MSFLADPTNGCAYATTSVAVRQRPSVCDVCIVA